MSPIRTGLVFGITVGVFYAACTAIWALAPESFLTFMNNLFHGMDFRLLVQPRPFSWSGFAAALLILSGWAMAAGAFFTWLSHKLSQQSGSKRG